MSRRVLRVVRLTAGLALLWLTGCGSTKSLPLTLDQLYQRAIADAAVAEPSEVSHSLERITPDNQHLRWRTGASGPQVLLVTWTGWTGYDGQVGQSTTLSREVWVTCVPDLHDFFATHPAADRELRTAQLLGLPPQPNKTRFVEFWAAPADLLRPVADPSITTDTAPADSQPGLPAASVGADYLGWYNALKATSYAPTGYPWTRLGYTFDWGDPSHEQGLSEFVVRAGATVDVAAAVTNSVYLTAN